MFDPNEYKRRTKRIQQKTRHITRQTKIAKENNCNVQNPHKFAKMSSMNCGNPNCVFCMNPRKSFNEKTLQERKFHGGADRDGME
jgi:hypothetical protein